MNEINRSINIAYIGGGSTNYCWKFIGEICQEPSLCGTVKLYDIDKKLSLNNEVIGNRTRELPESKTEMIFIAVDTLEEALRDSDFVIISISVGDLETQLTDIQIPESYGILQAVGNNTGPGGILRAMRIVPEYVNLANMIKENCPNAWVISLSEPMSACVKTLYTIYPEIKAFGCSNDIFSAQELLADIVAQKNNISSVSRREIKTNVIGINKFCFINEAMYNGDNLFDIYAEFVDKYASDGYEKQRQDYKNNPNASAHKVKFDMFLRYGLIAASSDKYLAENCPPWYLLNSKAIAFWKIGITSPAFLKRLRAEKLAKQKRILMCEESLHIGWSGTDCINQIKAIMGMTNIITNLVTINKGQVANLPIGSIVETNALLSKNNVKPVYAGIIPNSIAVLINRQVENNNMLVDAIISKNIDQVFNVFLNDPLMTLDINKATELYRQMLSVNSAYFGYYNKELVDSVV